MPFADKQTTLTRHPYMFTMFKKIEKAAACEMRSVIHFLNARNMKSADIHRQLCEVYGEHAESDSMVRRWVRHFNEGRENVHDDLRSCQPSVFNEDLVRAVEENIQENRRFTISSLSLHFPQFSRSLRFRKLCSCGVPKMLLRSILRLSTHLHLGFSHKILAN
jgi:hypothetical protein